MVVAFAGPAAQNALGLVDLPEEAGRVEPDTDVGGADAAALQGQESSNEFCP